MEELLCYSLLNVDNIVINTTCIPKKDLIEDEEQMIVRDPSFLIESFPEAVSVQQFSIDDNSITNNRAEIGYTYDFNLNAFIPPKPDETYILDTEDFRWYPDPNFEYELQNDGIMFKWIHKVGWEIVETQETQPTENDIIDVEVQIIE